MSNLIPFPHRFHAPGYLALRARAEFGDEVALDPRRLAAHLGLDVQILEGDARELLGGADVAIWAGTVAVDARSTDHEAAIARGVGAALAARWGWPPVNAATWAAARAYAHAVERARRGPRCTS